MSDPIDRQILKADLLCGDNAEHDYCFPCKKILECIDNQPAAQQEGRSGVFIPDITVKNLQKAPLEAVGELLVLGEMEDIVLPSAQPDNKLSKIAELVEGAIDHFDLDDAMDLLYQIKEVLKK